MADDDGRIWRYLRTGSVKHVLTDVTAYSAVCGASPLWFDPKAGWYGTGSQEEYESNAARRQCGRCRRILGIK